MTKRIWKFCKVLAIAVGVVVAFMFVMACLMVGLHTICDLYGLEFWWFTLAIPVFGLIAFAWSFSEPAKQTGEEQ